MSIKKLFLIGVLGLSFCMTGCGNGQKVDSEKEFSTNDISEIVINNSSWNLKILASSDDKIHVSYDGKIEDGVSNIQILQNESQLVIQQDTTSSKNIATQFSFGKAGKITLYIPKNTVLPLDINNGSGDMEIEAVNLSDFTMENDSGYVSMSDLVIENAKIGLDSGDIKITGSSCADCDIQTKSAYVTVKKTVTKKAAILTDAGEVNISGISDYTSLSIETGSGDITISHETQPDNLSYNVSSGSDDVTMQLQNAKSTTDTAGCKQGSIGKGKCSLSVMSDSGTISIK